MKIEFSQGVAAMHQLAGFANTLATFEVVPTGAALGAEIKGVDLSRPVPEEIALALQKTWADHMVLVFRKQNINDDQLVEAAGIFGGSQEGGGRKFYFRGGVDERDHRVSANPKITIISNIDANGNPVLDNGTLGSYEVVWHSDNTFIEVPPAGSMLYALEIPPEGGGGETSFSNQYLAYEELTDELKRAIHGRSQRHDSSRNSAGVLRVGAKLPKSLDEVEGPIHPLARVHPATGKTALYLGRRRLWPSNHIVGMPDEESQALLGTLWDHATQEKYTWTHHWQVGDLILWDNRCCMHYRTEIDTKYRRIMHRTAVKGEPVISPW
jgi:taurine dioxygenase